MISRNILVYVLTKNPIFFIYFLLGLFVLVYIYIFSLHSAFYPRTVSSPISQERLNTSAVMESHAPSEITDPLLEAARKVKDRTSTLLVPVINNAYLPFANNWLCNTKEMGLHKRLLIITTDDSTRDKLLLDWPEVNVVSMNVNTLGGDTAYGQAGFVKNNAKRHEYIYRLLKAGYEILHFDFDQVWLMNPLPVLQAHANLGFDFMVMRVHTSLREYCSGFVYIFNTERSVKLWELMVERLANYSRLIDAVPDDKGIPEYMIDQQVFTRLILNKTVKDLSFKLLSLDEFPDGKWYKYRWTTGKHQGVVPFVIHNNFLPGNAAKIERAKRFNHWFLDEDMQCNMDLVRQVVKS